MTWTTDRRCGTCRWYDPERNPETGRVLPTRGGSCVLPLPVPAALPWSIDPWVYGALNRRNRCWPGSGENCRTWEAKS